MHHRHKYTLEQQRESKFAPHVRCKGPHIRGFEGIIRTVIYPDHIDNDGKIKVEAIPSRDLTKIGWSVNRLMYVTKGQIDSLVEGYVERKTERVLSGHSLFIADDMRRIVDQYGFQAFVIRDSACAPEERAHALVFCSGKYKKSEVKQLRWKLIEKMTPQHPTDKILKFRELFPAAK